MVLPLLAVALFFNGSSAWAFTGGSIVVMRGGDANSPQATFGNGEVPAYIDEYSINIVGTTATATFLGSSAIPTSVLTLPGITANSHEGRLEISGNGQYLDFGGYQQSVSATVPRVINNSGAGSYYQVGQLKFDGTLSNSSIDTAIAKPQFVRGAYSTDGTQAWVASKNPTGGLEYISCRKLKNPLWRKTSCIVWTSMVPIPAIAPATIANTMPMATLAAPRCRL
jgi:hypothetical protein